jgi:hypothetical protein
MCALCAGLACPSAAFPEPLFLSGSGPIAQPFQPTDDFRSQLLISDFSKRQSLPSLNAGIFLSFSIL